jgi:phosphoglucomutase
MSLADQLQAAANSGDLLAASHDNIRALLAASDNPLYRASIEELAALPASGRN